MWRFMIDAPKDRPIIIVDASGRVHDARWVDQTSNWKRHEVHAWVSGDTVIDAPKLWTDKPSEYELSVAKDVG